MVEEMRKTGFKGDFPAFLHNLRTDPKFTAKTPDELLMHAAWIAKKFDAKASQFFGRLPRMRFAIKPVPADMAPFYTSGRGGPGLWAEGRRPHQGPAPGGLHERGPAPGRAGPRL